jgi:hypothetical protein
VPGDDELSDEPDGVVDGDEELPCLASWMTTKHQSCGMHGPDG